MQEPITNEASLVEQAVAGNKEAFGRLYVQLRDSIYVYIRARVDNDSDAEDLTSQVFLKAWEALPRYQQRETPFASWLYRIAHNLTLNHLRSSKHTAAPLHPELEPPDHEQPTTVEQVIAEEERAHLATAIEQLPEVQRQVIHLRFFEERSYPEIAAMMTKSLGSLRVIQHRALNNLSRVLGGPLSVILLVLLAATGIIYASEDSLPGEAYYPVKAAVESTRLATARDAISAAELHLAFASRRLDEADGLLTRQRAPDTAAALSAYVEQIDAVVAVLSGQQANRQEARLDLARHVLAQESEQIARITAIGALAPAEARPSIEAALARWEEATGLARALLGGPGGPGAPAAAPPSPTPEPPTATVAPTRTSTPAAADGALIAVTAVPTAQSPSPSPARPTATAAPTASPTEAPPTPTPPAVLVPAPAERPAPPAPTADLSPTPSPTASPVPPTATPTPSPSATSTPLPPVSDVPPGVEPPEGSAPTATSESSPTAPPTSTPAATPTAPPPTATTWPVVPGDPRFPISPGAIVAQQQATQRQLRAGEETTLVVGMANGTSGAIQGRIVVELPTQLEYIAGSASIAPAYDPQTRTLTWDGLAIPSQGVVVITYRLQAQVVSVPTPVTLTARFTVDGATVEPEATALTLVIRP